MKVIFLDFDGIINDYMTMDQINEDNIEVLKTILDETNAKVVVTSSHKYKYQRNNNIEEFLNNNYYVRALKDSGIEVIDLTPYMILKEKNENQREQEILEYLKNHPEVTQFLILDDDYIINSLKEHEIFLDVQAGLREKHIIPAIRILNGELSFYHDCTDEQIKETSEERVIRMNQIIKELEKDIKKKEEQEEER